METKNQKSLSFSIKRHIRENNSGAESQENFQNRNIGGIGASV